MKTCKKCGGRYYARDLCARHYTAARREANPGERDAWDRKYREQHREEKGLRDAAYREANQDRLRSYFKRHYQEHKDERRAYEARKKSDDLGYRLSHTLRNRARLAVKNGQRAGSAVRDLGCSVEKFKEYIEAQFHPEMSWDNWGLTGWHLDHIRPLSAFDLTDREQFLEAAHYTNYQPMWAGDNIRKGGYTVISPEEQ